MTGDERSAFFAQVDAYRPAGGCAAYRRLAGGREAPSRAACRRGPRDSEARGIPSDRVDLDIGASAMAQSKGRKDRVVHVADDLTAPCPGCLAWPRGLPGPRPDWFFPSRDPGRPLADTSAGRVFGRFRDATAFAPECSGKPVARDLRLGPMTDRADRRAPGGAGVEAMAPCPSRRVGHKDLQSTYHHVHTSEQLRDVIAKYDVTGSSAIPEAGHGQGWGRDRGGLRRALLLEDLRLPRGVPGRAGRQGRAHAQVARAGIGRPVRLRDGPARDPPGAPRVPAAPPRAPAGPVAAHAGAAGLANGTVNSRLAAVRAYLATQPTAIRR